MKKNIILTGSLAYDYIFDIPDSFSKYIQPDKIHKINISIVTDTHKKSNGGTAGNQAFYLAKLDLTPYILATCGNDFTDYKHFLIKNKIPTEFIKYYESKPTAAGFVMTDLGDNQIWMFSTGAMKYASQLKIRAILNKIENSLVLISPTDLAAMVNFVKESVELEVDFAFDPAFLIPHFPLDILTIGVKNARIIFGNDYEIDFIEKKLGKKITSIITTDQILVKTRGDKGSDIYYQKKWIRSGIYKTKTVDPTGAGDAYRAGFLYGYLNNQEIRTCAKMGAVVSSFAVEIKGTMNLRFTKKLFLERLNQ